MNEETFQVEMNHLADLSEAEFAEINKLRNGPRPESICTPAPKVGKNWDLDITFKLNEFLSR